MRSRHGFWSGACVFLALCELALAQSGPEFELSFAGPDALPGGGPREPVSADYDCVLTPGGDLRGQGAQGWVIGVSADGLRITSATTAGTAGARLDADPPGLRDRGASWERTELTHGPGNEGAVSAVVLSVRRPITLPSDRPSVILKLRVEGTTPDSGEAEAALFYRDGLRGSGIAVTSYVIWMGQSSRLVLGRQAVRLSSVADDFRRGDANLDGRFDISDSIFVLRYLFLGGRKPPCLDAADIDDSGRLDIADGHGINLFLFRGGSAPLPPGPFRCGSDPTADGLTCIEGGCP